MEKVYTQIYRQTQLGQSLEEALGDLDAGIDPSLKRKVLGHFDKVVHDTPQDCVIAHCKQGGNGTCKGQGPRRGTRGFP